MVGVLSMELFQQIATHIMRSILTALYQPFWGAVSMAFLFMFLFLYGKEKGWGISDCFPKMLQTWYREFRDSFTFRRVFLLAFYSTMILFRTLINREIWFDPLGKIMEGWGLYDGEGNLTTEAIENFMLFLPFTILLLWSFQQQLIGCVSKFRVIIWRSFQVVGSISFIIEFLQVLLHVGTFQLSDLCYNTLGGVFGGALYYCFLCRQLYHGKSKK